jgi:hypothetical protein
VKTRTRYLVEVQPKETGPYQIALSFLSPDKAQILAEALMNYGGYAGVRVLKVEEEITWSWKREKEGEGE